MYEIRRQGELRRQIEQKERELESISSKNKERMSRHGYDTGAYSGNSGLPPQSKTFGHRSGSASGLQHTAANTNQNYTRGRNGSPLRGSREGSQGVGYSSSYARSGSAGGHHSAVDETAKQSLQGPPPRFTASRPPIPMENNYVRQKSPKSPSSLRQK